MKDPLNLLIDTHILIWWLSDSPRLKTSTKRIIQNPNHTLYVSSVTIVEISIKSSINKLIITPDYIDKTLEGGFASLPLNFAHANRLKQLPYHHKDPIDRLLIAQAQKENLTLLTHDKIFKKYQIKTILN